MVKVSAARTLSRAPLAPALAQAVAAGFVGSVALPAIVGEGAATAPLAAAAWLVAALAAASWLLVVAPTLARAIAQPLDRLAERRPALGAAPARWLVITGYVALASTMLRRPLVAVLGPFVHPASAEAAFAAVALALLVVALIRLHRTASPLVADVAWRALDSLVPTTAAASTDQATTAGATMEAAKNEATRPAGPAGVAKTVAAAGAPDEVATRPAIASPPADGEVGETLPADEATVADRTLPAEGEDAREEATFPTVGDEETVAQAKEER